MSFIYTATLTVPSELDVVALKSPFSSADRLVFRTAKAKKVFYLDNVEGLWDVLILPAFPDIKNDTGIPQLLLTFQLLERVLCSISAYYTYIWISLVRSLNQCGKFSKTIDTCHSSYCTNRSGGGRGARGVRHRSEGALVRVTLYSGYSKMAWGPNILSPGGI